MRLAVISNVHANVEALRAVLRVIRRDGIRKVVCLGDLVGQHAFPVETLALIRAGSTACVAGNHDLMAIGRLTRDGRTPRTRRAIGWTRRAMTGADYEYLASLPAELSAGDDVLLLHGTLEDPAKELRSPADFAQERQLIRQRYPHIRICFVGHAREQRIVEVTSQSEVHMRGPRQLVLRPDAFFFVSPGSVGSPADGDYRAAYAIYDDTTRRVAFRRTTYDRLRVMQENLRHGLSSELAISPVGYFRARAVAAARSIRTRFAGMV
ncbi:MAG: metallophosphoesterase family protein [Gemmatimonadetes bacterium]|nr:metallophosphoesterase family protein [Gemmatimonadota bacterium]